MQWLRRARPLWSASDPLQKCSVKPWPSVKNLQGAEQTQTNGEDDDGNGVCDYHELHLGL